MRKFTYYIALCLVAVGLTACDEDYKDWADPQSNAPEEGQPSVTFQISNTSTTSFNLAEITSETVELVKAGAPSIEAKSVSYTLYIDKDETFAGKQKVESTVEGDVLSIKTADLEKLVVDFYGRRPESRTLYARIDVTAVTEGGAGFLARSNPISITVTPEAPVIETAYYITGEVVGDWGEGTIAKFEHSGNDVYEDPVFTLLIENPVEGANFKIIPQSGVDAGGQGFWDSALGTAVDGDDALEGTIVSTNAGAIKIAEKGWVKITLNMLAYTYKVEMLGAMPLPTTMFMNGTPWEWTWSNTPEMIPVNSHPGKFWSMQYFAAADEIKFVPVRDWVGDFGYGGATIPEASINYAGLTDSGGNIKIGNAGWYIVVVTTGYTDESKSQLAYTVEFLEPTVWLVGEASNGGWSAIATDPQDKFIVPATADGEFVSPAFVANTNELRLCVKLADADWWQSEFIILEGKIVYRGIGDDQPRVAVTAGQKAYLKFSDNTGRIE